MMSFFTQLLAIYEKQEHPFGSSLAKTNSVNDKGRLKKENKREGKM